MNWVGRFLLWNWRRKLKSWRVEAAPDLRPRPVLTAPIGLVGIWDLGARECPRFTLAFEDGHANSYLVLRLSNLPDELNGVSQFERVHRALLNIHEPNGRIEFQQLPPAIQRHVLGVIGQPDKKIEETK